ncbi:MAG: DNA-processing protein DprA [Rubripirellula sp.]|nr:DNA-processing protein DprA [Rubripirellula sp.]
MLGRNHAYSANSLDDPDQKDCHTRIGAPKASSSPKRGLLGSNQNQQTELLNDLTLALAAGIGPRTITRLLSRFANANEILNATPRELLSVPGIGNKLIDSIQNAKKTVPVAEILKWCERNGCRIHSKNSLDYPTYLRQVEDAPLVLFHQGIQDIETSPAVAIVGTRNPTPYGCKQAKRLSEQLSEAGIVIVSGLARGIDSVAHQACLDSDGLTVAVLGSGLGQIYPPENRELAKKIRKHGALLSEYAPTQRPNKNSFPRRNRIISGLSTITLVIEAPRRSGSLITARLALEQNRDVMAIPGPISSEMSRGCHELIRDGAKLVQDVNDILEEIPGGHRAPRVSHPENSGPATSSLRRHSLTDSVRKTSGSPASEMIAALITQCSPVEKKIIDAIGPEGSSIDNIIQRAELPPQNVIASISLLEIRGIVEKSSNLKIYLK